MNDPKINRLGGTGLYFGCISIFLVLSFILLMTKGNAGLFLYLNSNGIHDRTNDFIFKYATFIGDGWFAIIISLIFLINPRTQRLGLVSLSAYIVSGLLAQLIKRMVEAPRPAAIFNHEIYPYFVDGQKMAVTHSFPSGHTTTAFAMAAVLVCFSRYKWIQLNFLLVAVMVGFSRIYLAQHFPADVLGGAVIGTLIGTLAVFVSDKIAYKNPVRLFQRKSNS